jgi:hypothetical protein
MNNILPLAVITLLATPSFAQSTPVWNTVHLKAGQCVLIGNQQVCAEACGAATQGGVIPTPTPIITKSRFACVYDKHPEAEVRDVRTYAVIETVTTTGQPKERHFIKGFGMTGKADCEALAEKRASEEKQR